MFQTVLNFIYPFNITETKNLDYEQILHSGLQWELKLCITLDIKDPLMLAQQIREINFLFMHLKQQLFLTLPGDRTQE